MRVFLAAIAVAALSATPAMACVLLPPGTPEEQARRTLDWQTELADRATTIFLAEIVELRDIEVDGSPVRGRQVLLRPLHAVKGETPRRSLTLQHNAYTSCGLSPWWDVLRGERGQAHLVFATSAEPGQDDVIAVVQRDLLVQPDLLTGLAR